MSLFSKTLPCNGKTRKEINRYVICWQVKVLETKNDVRREDSDCRQELRERFLCQGPGHKVTLKKGPA